MSSPESGVERQLTVGEAQELLGIGKDAYGDRRKFLGVQHIKGEGNRVYLSLEDFELMEKLGEHIKEHGKMEGFVNPKGGKLAVSEESEIESVEMPIAEIPVEEVPADDLEHLIRAAAELKTQQLVMPQLVIQALADKMSYEDLPEDMKQRVDSVRNSASPKHPSLLADQLLQKHRSRAAA